MAYKGPPFNLDNPLMDINEPNHEHLFEEPHLPPLPITNAPFTTEQIDIIKDDQIITIMDGDYRRYLVIGKVRI